MRRARHFFLPITLSAALMLLNIALMVCWIILLAGRSSGAMAVGIVAFALILLGLSIYLMLVIKDRQLNRRQVNFVDSVTHELKSPIATIQLYLDTLQQRDLNDDQRSAFYTTLSHETQRLNALINQLLEVARLDAIGDHGPIEDIDVPALLRSCAAACNARFDATDQAFEFDMVSATVCASRMAVEMIFCNLFDNALKYGGRPPRVKVQLRIRKRDQIVVQIIDNGAGVPVAIRRSIFRLFFRGGDELHRTQKGTGVGLYIAQTLVRKLRGTLVARDRPGPLSGSVFEVVLPGVASACVS